jgi:CO/xanthine dehydrogenase Mo-binding subunit
VPFNLRDEMAAVLELPTSDVIVNVITVGGDFGAKGSPFEVPLAYHLARQTGRPVKFVLSSHEDLIATSPRHASVVTLRTGVRRDGKITAREARVIYNTGAYGAFKPTPIGMLGGARRSVGGYELPAFRIEAYCTYSNQVPCGYMRAPGSPQTLFAEEAHTDLVARAIGMDPVELRLRNLPKRSHGGVENVGGALLSSAADAIGWSSPKTGRKLVGRGISIVDRGTGVGEGSSDVTVNPDGTVTVLTGAPDNGTGALNVVAQVAAESFGIPLERVRVVRVSTADLPVDVGSGASRMTNVAGHAVIAAADKVKTQLEPLAATMLNADRVEWDGGGWRATNGSGTVSLGDLASEMIKLGDPGAHAQVTITTPRREETAFCIQAAEVEVDPETGEVHLLKMVNASEIGTIVNEAGHQGQIEGALVQGLGFALMEELAVDQGRVTAGSLAEYKEPTIRDVPPLTTITLATEGPGPFGAMAIGEIPHMATPGAIANAVADAIGAPILQLPITAERVLEALEAKRRG